MKKFYSFLFAAVALVGFAACNSDSTEDQPAPAPQVGKMEFTANIGEDTKTALDGLNVTWCKGDTIGIWDGTATKPFIAKETDGKSAKFTGMADLNQKTYYAVYPYVKGATCADGVWSGVNFNNNQEAKADSFACKANISYAESEGTTLNFQNSLAVLKFQVPVACELVEFVANSALLVKAWAPADKKMQPETDYYVTVPAGNYQLTARVDGYLSVASTKTLEVVTNKIYNLGTLPELQKTTVYLVPGKWASDNADFAVYFWYAGGAIQQLMTKDNTKNGVYMAEVSTDVPGLLFKRLNPADHENEWDQTADLTLPADEKDHYYVTDWAAGEWREYVQTQWALAGTFNNWEDMPMTRKDAVISVAEGVNLKAYDKFKVKDATTWDTNYGAGFSYMNPGCYASVAFGGGDIAVTETGTYDIYFDEVNTLVYVVTAGSDYTTATEQTKNGPEQIAVELAATNITATTATITITSNGATVKYLKVNDGTAKTFDEVINNGTEVTLTGGVYTMNLTDLTANTTYYYYAAAKDENDKQQVLSSLLEFKTLEADEQVVDNNLYLTPNANWKKDGARFAAYFFGNGEKWVSMTDSNKDGVYEVAKQNGYPNVIFCRMNPNVAANNWTNRWNQTKDLAIPTNGNNHYTVAEGAWDKGNGTWSTYTPTK